ncbi:MAG: hypothetical protein UR39_C0012G0013 [Candidatus Woesebacteria bacterium GW2011_GWA1_33_30]|uniref:Uncharacterized protein n=1 Tax=Candidatus Woesebacteria bacterium GW2011_GWA2_33_28 TaxID=1618561 RepID=A0A0G0A539_9BACT|nr:MAG: hypothetical protein UR38_C0012G0013 [Candidatus Woesebacteria bacterium GW2011_GWA2_33_28]KKP46932.1 MAG: hypothetical protein UR39_C0012G0013 [Candidatus Woesebacteria bacterium GW2011_GWA1_33_30]KKP48662.1 MAG: hypothetical protein UR40_C0013G0013 [Microgenomates group bacterium GW2011_GWC1_33_32]KKP51351.1 MAG: hypothetical protein UR44_C0012G0013 [Candidatus Woesebacteria bacterium GW2011_GWB1_33_38]KKP57282.1 MAG: hypothetical protein UR48_C0021G0006 [Microgenomates group bacteriu
MIDISATVGSQSLSIYGYGPVASEVSLIGIGVSERTNSLDNGYFRFSNISAQTYNYPELCLQAKDIENRVTQPSCIPALPVDDKVSFEVGPVLLSPTLSISDNNLTTNEEVIAKGLTTPNSEVSIYIAKSQNQVLQLVKTANAYYLPNYQIRSKTDGSFEFSLPTTDRASYKIFASTKVGENLSAKSTTLTFIVISRIKSFLDWLWEFFLNNKTVLLIVLELVIIIILGIMVLKQPTRRKKITKKTKEIESIKEKYLKLLDSRTKTI